MWSAVIHHRSSKPIYRRSTQWGLRLSRKPYPFGALVRIPIVRPLFFVFGLWHALVSVLAGLYGVWLLARSILTWWGDDVFTGAMLLICGLITLPALGVAAQGGKGVRSAGAALALPCFLMSLRALEWGGWIPNLWLHTLPFVPGAVLGALAMTRQEKAA